MRKMIFLMAMLALAGGLFAEDVILDEIPGTYVYYKDSLMGSDAVFGIAYLGGGKFLLRGWDSATDDETLAIMGFTFTKEQGIEPAKDLNILKDAKTSKYGFGYMWARVQNILQTWYPNSAQIKASLSLDLDTDDHYYYKSWIPLFQLDHCDGENFSILTSGRMKLNGDPAFFKFAGIPQASPFAAYDIAPKDKVKFAFKTRSLALDKNWSKAGTGKYVLNKVTGQDAAVFFEEIDLKKTGIASVEKLIELVLSTDEDRFLVAGKSSVEKIGKNYFITFDVIDYDTNNETIQITKLEEDKGIVTLTSLAAYYDLYQKNKAYFDAILHQ